MPPPLACLSREMSVYGPITTQTSSRPWRCRASRSRRAISIADLVAQSPQGRVLESKFKGLSDVALTEAKRGGCTYADIRFTRSQNSSVTAQRRQPRRRALTADSAAAAGGAAAGRRTWRRRRRGAAATADAAGLRRPRDPQRRLGLCQQPDRDRGRDPAHHAHRHGSRQGQRHRQEGRRQARAGARRTRSTGRRR